jgi:hypothetical protein
MPSKFYFFLLCCSFYFGVSSQSLTGTNGLFRMPSAYVNPDGYTYLGVSFLPKGYYNYLDDGDSFTGMPSFITLSLFNKVEFMFRYTHQLGQVVSPETQYFPDRMFAIRINLIPESESKPALTFGFHDISEALGGTTATPWFLASYIVSSKTFSLKKILISPTMGYAYNIFKNSYSPVFDGFFAGIEISNFISPNLSFVSEYDSNTFNVAIKANLFKHLSMSIGLLDLSVPSGFLVYNFNLAR